MNQGEVDWKKGDGCRLIGVLSHRKFKYARRMWPPDESLYHIIALLGLEISWLEEEFFCYPFDNLD